MKFKILRIFQLVLVVFILVPTIFVPISVLAELSNSYTGFDKGIPWQPFVPLKKVTFVHFDTDSYLDDYAYLAAIPANVFSDGDIIYCNPLLFYQQDGIYPDNDKYRFLNDYQGISYLMEDWMSWCGGQLDKLTTINIPPSEFDSTWESRIKTNLESANPFDLASKIALDEWSYSESAVVAVIEEDFEKPEFEKTMHTLSGTISGTTGKKNFKINRSHGPSPEYQRFTIEEGYKFVHVDLWYPSFVVNSLFMKIVPGFPNWFTVPSVDPDLQLYVSYEGDWLQTAVSSHMAITEGPHEEVTSYVYAPGSWRVGVTNMPTEGNSLEELDFTHYLLGRNRGKFLIFGNILAAFLNAIGSVTKFNCDITLYPGTELTIPEKPPFGCRDATFNLTWDNKDVNLGLTIIGPSGEELESVMDKTTDYQELHFDQLGECLEGESYRVVVFGLEDVPQPVDFKIEYSWDQNISKKQADCLASACEGAVLSSIFNAPLLYTTSSEFSDITKETLNKLGVDSIYLVDLGGYLQKKIKTQISDILSIETHYTEYKEIYDEIMTRTGSNDVIFSTIDPWSYWYYSENIADLNPAGKFKKAFHFGPAAFAAAYHGSPLLLVDNHPELSGGVMWHNEFWRKYAAGFKLPSSAPMVITGRRVYDFLEEYEFDREGRETMLTIAGQYDIGPSWSRVFAGVAASGNFIGSPIDVANSISRSIFYPALIFENPAVQGEVELINGSITKRVHSTIVTPLRGILQRLLQQPFGSNLKFIRKSGPTTYTYPVLHTYGCYTHRFNERGAQYWNSEYHTRDGIIPGKTVSYNEIDEGVRLKNEGIAGSYYPDITSSEITPFYARKAGYSNCFSTNFDSTIENLNNGVITWYLIYHGYSGGGGILAWYSPTTIADMAIEYGIPQIIANRAQNLLGRVFGLFPKQEVNPWRGSDHLYGSTEEPDSAALGAEIGLITGLLGIGMPHGPLKGGVLKTGLDVVPTNIPPLKFNRNNYFDGLVGPYSITAMLTKYRYSYPAKIIDDRLENLHSMNWHSGACLIACNYLHIAMMRHGSVLQEIDPWPTSYWAGVVFQDLPKEFALGKTIGDLYADGRERVGIKYLFEDDEEHSWWWDDTENVVLFADPDLRIWVPTTEWDAQERNHWEKDDVTPVKYDDAFSVHGHMPFGVTKYPHKYKPLPFWLQYWWVLMVILAIGIITVVMNFLLKRKKV